MSSSINYVCMRGGVYQYHRRVPVSVQRRPDRYSELFASRPLYRQSLRTSDRRLMFAAADKVHREFEAKLALALAKPKPVRAVVQTLRKVTQADLNSIVERYREITVQPFERAHLYADSRPGWAEELERMHYELEVYAAEHCEALRPGAGSSSVESIDTPAEAADFLIELEGFDAPAGTPEYGGIVQAIRSGKEQGYRQIADLRSGAMLPRLPGAKAKASEPKSASLRECVERYIEHTGLSKKSESEVRLTLKTFESVVGSKSLSALTRDDCRAFVEHLAKQKVGGKSVGSVERPMAAQTIKKRLGFINAAINLAIERGWFSGSNPASGINVNAWAVKRDPSVMPAKRRFQIGELNKLFQHSWFTGCKSATRTHERGSHRLAGSEYWAPLVALFSGCRASELGGLRLAEVLIDDPFPHFLVRDNEYRRTKKGYSRCVPILDVLFDLGFREYVNRIKRSATDRLFPDWKSPTTTGDFNKDDAAWSNARVIRAFNRTVIPAALGDTLLKGARREVTFHSFRGAFKAMLGSSEHRINQNIIHEVVGHSKSELDQSYIGTVELTDTYKSIHKCRYDGLILPSHPAF